MPKLLKEYEILNINSGLGRFNQRFCLLSIGQPHKKQWLFWDLMLKAPIDVVGGVERDVLISEEKVLALSYSENKSVIIQDNKAGPNGETLTLEEIVKLYT